MIRTTYAELLRPARAPQQPTAQHTAHSAFSIGTERAERRACCLLPEPDDRQQQPASSTAAQQPGAGGEPRRRAADKGKQGGVQARRWTRAVMASDAERDVAALLQAVTSAHPVPHGNGAVGSPNPSGAAAAAYSSGGDEATTATSITAAVAESDSPNQGDTPAELRELEQLFGRLSESPTGSPSSSPSCGVEANFANSPSVMAGQKAARLPPMPLAYPVAVDLPPPYGRTVALLPPSRKPSSILEATQLIKQLPGRRDPAVEADSVREIETGSSSPSPSSSSSHVNIPHMSPKTNVRSNTNKRRRTQIAVGSKVSALYPPDGYLYAARVTAYTDKGSYIIDWDDGHRREREREEDEIFLRHEQPLIDMGFYTSASGLKGYIGCLSSRSSRLLCQAACLITGGAHAARVKRLMQAADKNLGLVQLATVCAYTRARVHHLLFINTIYYNVIKIL